MRVAISLCADFFRPNWGELVPHLVAMSPYGKESRWFPIPPQPPTAPVYSRVELGSPSFFVDHRYSHVIAGVRESGNPVTTTLEVEPITPGEVTEYRIELAPIATLFLSDYQLRLSVAPRRTTPSGRPPIPS